MSILPHECNRALNESQICCRMSKLPWMRCILDECQLSRLCFSVDIKRGAISSVPDCINQGLKHITLQCGGPQGVVDVLFVVAAERF